MGYYLISWKWRKKWFWMVNGSDWGDTWLNDVKNVMLSLSLIEKLYYRCSDGEMEKEDIETEYYQTVASAE